MNYRINTRIIILVAALVVVAIGLFTYTLVSAPTPEEVPVVQDQTQDTDMVERIINARRQFVDGIHTIVGKAEVPTPCHRIISEPLLLEDGTVIEIRFNTLLEGEECAAVMTEVPFRVTFEAPENIMIRATWDGSPVRLNLVPVGPGEVLEDEFYIKG